MDTIYFIESSFLNISYYTEMRYLGHTFGKGTSFFYKDDENDKSSDAQWYLITNYHVMSGRDPETQRQIDPEARITDTLRVYIPYRENENSEKWNTTHYIDFRVLDDNGKGLWADLPIGKESKVLADVAVLPVKIEDAHINDICSAEEPMNKNVTIEMGSELYVIGFPFGRAGGFLPIWKRASIASHVLIGQDDQPFFFVDTATRSGMSGSPVIYYEKRPIALKSESKKEFSTHFTKFIGIYSGRLGADSKEGDAQLGRVWRGDVLGELIKRSKANMT